MKFNENNVSVTYVNLIYYNKYKEYLYICAFVIAFMHCIYKFRII